MSLRNSWCSAALQYILCNSERSEGGDEFRESEIECECECECERERGARLQALKAVGEWQLEIEYADQTEITNIEAEINADKSFIATLQKHIDASTSLSDAEKAQLDAELKAEEADLARLEEQLSTEQAKVPCCFLSALPKPYNLT